jgi:hypothetical protein
MLWAITIVLWVLGGASFLYDTDDPASGIDALVAKVNFV